MFSPEGTHDLALSIVALYVAALAAWLARGIRRSHYGRPQFFIYLLGDWLARILWRANVVGRLPETKGAGAIIVCNHRSPFDPAVIQLATDRVVHWMVAREYCESRLTGWFLRLMEVIPTGRSGIDTASTKAAIRYAERGGLVGMFPEGRLNATDQLLLPGRPGVALVALKSRVPVIPCYISGSPVARTVVGSLFVPARARLVIGQPIDLSPYFDRPRDRAVLEDLTRRMLNEIARLAGQPDYPIALAGRHWKPEE